MTEFSDRRLMDCKNIKECSSLLSTWDKELKAKAHRSLRHLGATQEDLDKFDCLLGNTGSSRSPIMSNRHVRRKASRILYRALLQIRKNNPNDDFVWVTIISGEWETSDEITKIDLNSLSGATRRTLSAIAPDYLAIIETCAFSNLRADLRGKLLSPHMHSIIWGKDAFAKSLEVKAGHVDRYEVTSTKAPTIVVKKIGPKKADFARLASYCFKAPHRCKNYYQSRDGETRNLHEGTKTDRYIRFLRLAQIYSMQTIDNVVFAGGDGAKVRSAMLKGVKGRIALKTVCGNELIHRDAIPHYWAELLPRLNQSRFQLPFIRTRK